MPTPSLSPAKIKQLLILATCSGFSKTHVAHHLRISRSTLQKYLSALKRSCLTPSTIQTLTNSELAKRFLNHQRTSRRSDRYTTLDRHFQTVHLLLETEPITLERLWTEYSLSHPRAYSYSTFCERYSEWREANNLPKHTRNKKYVCVLEKADLDTLKKWCKSSDRRLWEKTSALHEMSRGHSIKKICKKIERSRKTILQWLQIYRTKGLSALSLPRTRKIAPSSLDAIKERGERLLRLIHEPPQLHGVNRASWSLVSLAKAYENEYGTSISKSTVSDFFKRSRYKFKKAKKVLTSTDPNFREKLKVIKQTLAELEPEETVFSIDEFGPFSVKMRGGRALVPGNSVRTIPQRQKSRGSLICTASLELSTNQVTQFYSKKKNTDEMIKLMMILINQYKQQRRLFLSWDTASWHMSKALYKKVDEVNNEQYRKENASPRIELIPLPSGAQFLNVIESVFSGMSRAILHNNNYQSVDECKAAIDRYFEDRNRFFRNNPKRAGNKIWGSERVATVFKEANLCKDPNWR
jgi:transposase